VREVVRDVLSAAPGASGLGGQSLRLGTLAAFATFAVGFLARPFGGLFFGHSGDRMGRKPMLVATLLLVGGGTFLIGLLPTYATIGIWAPVLLLLMRLLQGFGAGAEYGGAVIMAVEFAPRGNAASTEVLPRLVSQRAIYLRRACSTSSL
jgi:MFS family permease